MEKVKDPFGSLDFSLQRVLVGSEIPVLLLGESGTGKTRMAREIHERSGRRLGPFVSVNLASIHEGTLESTLYGHEKGAFTGAHQARRGKFIEAHGGTLFLDEIGDVPLHVQVRLLEFLQERKVLPLGGTAHRSADVRIIAATHQDLSRQVEEGAFRGDL